MELASLDQKNPGKLISENFSVAGGLSANSGDQNSSPVKFVILKNCLPDKRIGAILKRPGSVTETIASSLGIPIGGDEFISGAAGSMPVNRAAIVNFSGVFYQQVAGTWSLISQTSFTSFATSTQGQFCQMGSTMLIAGGLPAKWKGPGTTIDRLGIVAPTDPILIASINTLTGTTLTVGTQYMYTFYDSGSGLESDWSPLSAITGPVTNHAIVLTIPAATQKNWDKIKIYRTLDGGTTPYLVGISSAGTLSYTDVQSDAQLTQKSADRYDHAAPPTSAFICESFAQCFWIRDPNDPFKLLFSKPYTGDATQLEYYPIDNFVIANEPITGLFAAPGKLLVFHPRSISAISGFSADDFAFQPYIPGVGTLFPKSISTNGTSFLFLAEQGWVSLPFGGGSPTYISREIDLDLQPILAGAYNTALRVSSCWNPSLRQFICLLSAQSSAGAPWEEVGTGNTATAVAGWETAPGASTDIWEDVANPSAAAAMKIKIWGWSPELSGQGENLWCEYTYSDLANDNTNGTYPVFVFHPSPSSDTSDPQQDKTFMGYYDGTQGKVKTLFRKDTNTDSGQAFTAELLTGRILPGQQIGNYKLFHNLCFNNSYSDPTSDSLATIKYLRDFDDPQIRSFAGSLITITDTTDIKAFPSMKAKHVHLYITDTSQSQTKILLSQFYVQFRERLGQESR